MTTTITKVDAFDIRFRTSHGGHGSDAMHPDPDYSAAYVILRTVGLCEYAQHLAIFDHLCVSGSLENRIVEYVDHLHEHLVDPVAIREGRYLVPTAPGFSITMKPESLRDYEFPGGAAWRQHNEPGLV